MRIKNVIFDLGGVLLEWHPEKILAACFDEPATRDLVRRGTFHHPDWHDIDRGTLLEPDAIARFSQRCGRGHNEIAGLFQEVRRSLQPIAGTVQLLEDLHARNIPLYCLSNMSEPFADYLQQHYVFFQLFRGIVISAAVQLIKPEPAIFQHAIETFGVCAAQTVFIDDLLPNVQAARDCGLHAIHFTSPQDCREQLTDLLT